MTLAFLYNKLLLLYPTLNKDKHRERYLLSHGGNDVWVCLSETQGLLNHMSSSLLTSSVLYVNLRIVRNLGERLSVVDFFLFLGILLRRRSIYKCSLSNKET